ncbi:MAG: AAA family ATPase [Pirellulales bacterium]|nr:AAA family ATPase [Pirellulales bacterium]
MLNALELVGFKSFADRTRFEFPPGITVVVGPNGSGKSNVVDAIKWVLGEQSIKSLRGKEMADVIFNGSGSRRAMNTGEVTLTFNNANGLFPIDSAEVHITRRIYRSGEGEYLINRNPARLRDIRDLLSGTGMGTQAYSVIEQGKVDVLLQSSAKDRRLIFEEAAGISRFKMRKLEAQRRLERVDQNLLRLHDIVDEVENRLKSVRAQAGKARRYKEYADRLQELRTQVAMVDWRRLSERLAGIEAEILARADERDAGAAAVESLEARLLEIDGLLGEIIENIRTAEARISANRERIAAAESSIDHERARFRDLEQEIARHGRQLVGMSARSGDLEKQLSLAAEEKTAAERQYRQIARNVAEAERGLTEAMAALDRLRGESEERRVAYMRQMRISAALGNESGALEAQVAAAGAAAERCRARIAELDGLRERSLAEFARLRQRCDSSLEEAEDRRLRLAAAADELNGMQRELALKQEEAAALRRRQTGTAERAAVLEDLMRRQEGVGAGVKEILARCRDAAEPALRGVHGLVADLINVGVDLAPLVEIALGQAAQHLVASPTRELIDFLQMESPRLGGRVGILWFDERLSRPAPAVDLQGRPGVLGRADRFVETAPRFAPLAERLLGRTWFVEKLADALQLQENISPLRASSEGWPGAGNHLNSARSLAQQISPEDTFASLLTVCSINFVTLAGELLEADGTLHVGPRHTASGIISRRSELRALKAQLIEIENAAAEIDADLHRLEDEIARRKQALASRQAEHQRAIEAIAEMRLAVNTAEQRRLQLDEQFSQQQTELDAAGKQHDDARRRLAEALEQRRQLDLGLAETESLMARLSEQLGLMENQRLLRGRETTEIKVELAKCEERLRNLDAQLRQLEENREERRRTVAENRELLAQSKLRAEASQWSILRAEAEIAELYLRKESFASQTVGLLENRESLQSQRVELGAEAQKIRAKIRKLEEKIHAQELAAGEVRHERGGLADRLREDYGIELAELEHDPSIEERHEREAVQREIDDLRRKLNYLGNVNLEALEELEQLESRYNNLAEQYRDLADAKNALEKIIEKINADSRRLFAETLDTVRGHFQQLFRDLFGGGQADIVMEEGVDILDSGIEIVARPPGKEPRNISLLSGGEKTLTCVALLLAIFRSRPSPFCVLDEVDAALDEANIDRFTKVLQDFLAWTQFIIVTHSKKTMTCANSIYGVTMQESGVSKQVSVCFEDVSEDGHIRAERLNEEGAAQEEKEDAA